jgi:cyclophilin family peptidyl-prolyl cis-trans isomerase
MFTKEILVLAVILCVATTHWALADDADPKQAKTEEKNGNPVVVMETTEGIIKIELWPDRASVTVKNFLRYVNEGFYEGTLFHRVIENFMIQGGGFTNDMKKKQTHEAIKNEATAELKNDRGTIAMARTRVIDSATSQFFINVKENEFLNHKDKTPEGFGYAVFGKVIEGMDVVDKVSQVKTTTIGPYQNVPVKPVIIKSMKVLERKEKKE